MATRWSSPISFPVQATVRQAALKHDMYATFMAKRK
jgi:glutamine synthetase